MATRITRPNHGSGHHASSEKASSTMVIHAVEGGPSKRFATHRLTCLGGIYSSDAKEREAVCQVDESFEPTILLYMTEKLALDPVFGRAIAGSLKKVATDFVAWFVVNKMHPEDDEGESYMMHFVNQLRSIAKLKIGGNRLTDNEAGSVAQHAIHLAVDAVGEYLLDIHPEADKIRARRAQSERDYQAEVARKAEMNRIGKEEEEEDCVFEWHRLLETFLTSSHDCCGNCGMPWTFSLIGG